MKIKTSELIGPALDWAVAKCEIPNDVRDNRPRFWLHPNNPKLVCRETYNHETNPKGYELCRYSTDWAQGGPIIDRLHIRTEWSALWSCWLAHDLRHAGLAFPGATRLIAAMRCYVASKLGDEVDVPEELL